MTEDNSLGKLDDLAKSQCQRQNHFYQIFPKLVSLVILGWQSLIYTYTKFNTPRMENGIDRES